MFSSFILEADNGLYGQAAKVAAWWSLFLSAAPAPCSCSCFLPLHSYHFFGSSNLFMFLFPAP
jgi:hypothetical protein